MPNKESELPPELTVSEGVKEITLLSVIRALNNFQLTGTREGVLLKKENGSINIKNLNSHPKGICSSKSWVLNMCPGAVIYNLRSPHNYHRNQQ